MAINPLVKQLATKVRNAIYGSEVRESIAKSMEVTNEVTEDTKNRQDNVEGQFQAVLDKTTDKDFNSAPEITASRVGADGSQHANLKQRLDAEQQQVRAQLAHTKGNHRLRIIGHRGVGYAAPENTLPSFEMAGQLGLWATEGDFFVTKDGHWVVSHDRSVDRMTDGSGWIDEMTLAQVRSLTIDAGSNISYYENLKMPTLEEFLEVCNRYGTVPVIEVKGTTTTANLQNLLNIVDGYGLLDIAIFTFLTKETTDQMIALNPYVFIEHSVYTYSREDMELVRSLNNGILALEYATITKDIMAECRRNGVKVSAWTINTGDALQKVKDFGVDQIYTDVFI